MPWTTNLGQVGSEGSRRVYIADEEMEVRVWPWEARMRYCEGSMLVVLVLMAGGERVSGERGSRLKRCFSLLATRVCSSGKVTCMDARRRQRSWGEDVRGVEHNYGENFWRTLSDWSVF